MKIKLAILSAGLGNVSRGFEMSAATWHTHLAKDGRLESRLFSGGRYPGSTTLWNISRNSTFASLLKKAGVIKDGCRLEQLTFSIGFLLKLIVYKPDVIWLQEISLAQMLLKYRKTFGLKVKIIFCDGAPVGHHLAKPFDHIVFLHEYARQDALKDQLPAEKMSVIPHVSMVPNVLHTKKEAKKHFHISPDDFVILCVAAWNKHHKRVDYLIRETAKLQQKNITLFLCGQPENETVAIQEEAKQTDLHILWRTLSADELSIAYDTADLFILPSLGEGLGAVLIEAGFHNIPVICHKHDAAKFIFGENYNGLADLSASGNLSQKIQTHQQHDLIALGLETGNIIRENFAPKKLTDRFVEMVTFTINPE